MFLIPFSSWYYNPDNNVWTKDDGEWAYVSCGGYVYQPTEDADDYKELDFVMPKGGRIVSLSATFSHHGYKAAGEGDMTAQVYVVGASPEQTIEATHEDIQNQAVGDAFHATNVVTYANGAQFDAGDRIACRIKPVDIDEVILGGVQVLAWCVFDE